MMDRVLIIDHKVATPDRDSGSLRMVNLIRVLRDFGQTVTYLPQTLSDVEERPSLLSLCDALSLEAPTERSVRRHLKRHISQYQVVVLSRVGTAQRFLPLVRRTCPQAWTVFDTVDLHHLRERRQAEVENDTRLHKSSEEVRRRELELIRATDETLVVSNFEARHLARECPDARIRVISNIHDIPENGHLFEDRQDLLFMAGFEHLPNIDAALWLVREIMPRVWERLPETKVMLVGSSPPKQIRSLQCDRVVVTGFVPSMRPFLDRARLSLAPLRYGAGVKGKITESLAAGLPVVATPIATEGMPIEDGRDILMADGPGNFADAIVRAYLDGELWHRLARQSRETAVNNYSFDAARRAVNAFLREIPSKIDGDE